MRPLSLIVLLFLAALLIACSVAAAAEPTPTPTPKPPAPSPQNVRLSAGDTPYLQATWNQPPEDIQYLGLET